MSYSQSARSARPRTRSHFLAVLVVVAAPLCVLGCSSLAGLSSGSSTSVVEPSAHNFQVRLHGDRRSGQPQGEDQHELGVADGEVPDDVTVFDERYPAVTNLDPALLAALRRAASEAVSDGVGFYVNSGWRSPAYQEHLLDEAISKYGSREEAARWVATPTTSPHVSGYAVDIGHSEAAAWLSEHGAEYGLCQIYSNEPWHYELRPDAVDHGCPPRYADPTHDPRMQQ
jgi:zinc D-Ala-D-Ala carboxypeptidase